MSAKYKWIPQCLTLIFIFRHFLPRKEPIHPVLYVAYRITITNWITTPSIPKLKVLIWFSHILIRLKFWVGLTQTTTHSASTWVVYFNEVRKGGYWTKYMLSLCLYLSFSLVWNWTHFKKNDRQLYNLLSHIYIFLIWSLVKNKSYCLQSR